MIANFNHPGLERLFFHAEWSQVHAPDPQKIRRILARLHRAAIPAEMDVPGFRLAPAHRSDGDYWSVTITGPHLILFRMVDGHARDVTLSTNY